MERRISSRQRPILCAVLDAAAFGSDPRAFAAGLFEAGVDWIQLRERALEGERLFRLARQILAAARGDTTAASNLGARPMQSRASASEEISQDGPRVLINRRVDIALASSADGVQLGFDAIDPQSARRLLGEAALIGASFHSIAEIETAVRVRPAALSYALLAPIWNPNSKAASRPALGPSQLAEACRSGLPILAQGGLDPERAEQAIAAGASGIAVTGQLTGASDPMASAERLRRALDASASPMGIPTPDFRNRITPSGDREAAQ